MANNLTDNIISENHTLRSAYIGELLFNPICEGQQSSITIPKVIVQFWDNHDQIPADVQNCIESWESFIKEGFTKVLFNELDARSFIEANYSIKYVMAFDNCRHPAMKCDYFRLCYILAKGGFYVDADEVYQGLDIKQFFNDDNVKFQPLCYDCLTDSMVPFSTFSCVNNYSKDWIYYINNNPLIAPAHHPLVSLALERATKLLIESSEPVSDIQSTTGPGNLTASLVEYSLACNKVGLQQKFAFIPNWDLISISAWPLSYRNDERNWRLWRG